MWVLFGSNLPLTLDSLDQHHHVMLKCYSILNKAQLILPMLHVSDPAQAATSDNLGHYNKKVYDHEELWKHLSTWGLVYWLVSQNASMWCSVAC